MNTSSWHDRSIQDVLDELETTSGGLSLEVLQRRRESFGENALPKQKKTGALVLLIQQFTSPMMLILLVAAGMSLFLGDYVDTGVIFLTVVVNAIIGFIQEYKANNALEALRSLVQPRAIVLRDGKEVKVTANDLVPGDILVLQTGDQVSADARLTFAVDILSNESALTGESYPVHKIATILPKDTPMAERTNMVYAGTSIVGGRAKAVIVSTGIHTELGAIAKLVEQTQETRTPLQEQLSHLARMMTWLVVGMVVVLFLLGILAGKGYFEMFETSVALVVAAIPEGLMVSVTIILAIGMQRILRRKALVRRLVAAETLGSVSIICSDKTGTITQGEMRVTHLVTPKQTWTYPFVPGEEPDTAMRKIFQVMALCNDATVVPEDEEQPIHGNPTERALMGAVLEQALDVKSLMFQLPRIDEVPFSSERKYMLTAHTSGSHTEVFLKGGPGVVTRACSSIQTDGSIVLMGEQERAFVKEQELDLTKKGIRLMAIAVKTQTSTQTTLKDREMEGFTFLGFVGLRDPLRPHAREQIESAKRAGIRTVIITGDHTETARAIGIEAGLILNPDAVVKGSEIDAWSDEELVRRVPRIAIYARVEPRHKIRIIQAWQARGEVVAMTGDGVNDAPALKASDIGVAVGFGTEVAKQASDMVILDNDLGTITAAIEEGRVIFDNIRKVVVYLMANSFTEIILIGGSLLMGLPIPLLPIQILWINLVADSFPNIGLTFEPAEKDVMSLPPRGRGEPVLNQEMVIIIFVIGVITDLVLFCLYIFLLGSIDNIDEVRSIMFAAVGIESLFYIFAVKSFRRTIFQINPFSNLWLIAGVFVGFSLMLLALEHPFFQFVFDIVPLSLSDWGLLLMMGLIKLCAIELTKGYFIHKRKRITV